MSAAATVTRLVPAITRIPVTELQDGDLWVPNGCDHALEVSRIRVFRGKVQIFIYEGENRTPGTTPLTERYALDRIVRIGSGSKRFQ